MLIKSAFKIRVALNDITECDIKELLDSTQTLDIQIKYTWINDLELIINKNVDMTFIDTWHVYAQLHLLTFQTPIIYKPFQAFL